MNREIKYRAWLKDEKKMINSNKILNISFLCQDLMYEIEERIHYPTGVLIKGDSSVVDFDDIELMQYTCLKDKNGVEIYEGDIVKGFSRNAVVKIGFPHNEKNHSYGVYAEWTKYKLQEVQYINNYVFENLEVIGNIYENPELLGEENEPRRIS